jgi:general secretion pathway protein G
VRTAKNAAVGGEINQLAQALAQFKNQYGDYPPSRILLVENGDYSSFMGNAALVSNFNTTGAGDITIGQLAVRSVSALRKFFPRVALNTTPLAGATGAYDFNGNGTLDTAYILQGHEALVFFLGGIPKVTSSGVGMTGFCKNPTNPFVGPNATGGGNRQPPFYQFDSSRLFFDTNNPYAGVTLGKAQLILPQIPGYLDSLGNATPTFNPLAPINFYAYFSSYGNGNYDPNDVNFAEVDNQLAGPIGMVFEVNFSIPTPAMTTVANTAGSLAPNPYTNTLTVPGNQAPTFINPQSFQIISSGIDGLYGMGGQYNPNSAAESLTLDTTANVYFGTSETGIRVRERDNVTNFHNGKLE